MEIINAQLPEFIEAIDSQKVTCPHFKKYPHQVGAGQMFWNSLLENITADISLYSKKGNALDVFNLMEIVKRNYTSQLESFRLSGDIADEMGYNLAIVSLRKKEAIADVSTFFMMLMKECQLSDELPEKENPFLNPNELSGLHAQRFFELLHDFNIDKKIRRDLLMVVTAVSHASMENNEGLKFSFCAASDFMDGQPDDVQNVITSCFGIAANMNAVQYCREYGMPKIIGLLNDKEFLKSITREYYGTVPRFTPSDEVIRGVNILAYGLAKRLETNFVQPNKKISYNGLFDELERTWSDITINENTPVSGLSHGALKSGMESLAMLVAAHPGKKRAADFGMDFSGPRR